MISAIKRVLSKKIFAILAIIQLSIGIYALIMGISTYRFTTYRVDKFKETFDAANTINMKDNVTDCYSKDVEKTKRLFQFYEYVKTNPKIKGFGTFFSFNAMIPELKDIPFIKDNGKTYLWNNELCANINTIYIDEDLNKICKLSVSDGKTLGNGDFNKESSDIIPILVGSNFSKYVKLGDDFTTMSGGKKFRYKTVGILKENSEFITSGRHMVSSLESLNDKIVMPMHKDYVDNEDIAAYFTINRNMLIKTNDKTVMEQLNNKAKALNLTLEATPLTEDIKEFNNTYKDSIRQNLSNCIFTKFIFSNRNNWLHYDVYLKKKEGVWYTNCNWSYYRQSISDDFTGDIYSY